MKQENRMDPGGQWLVHRRERVTLREFRGFQFGQSRWGGRWDMEVMRAGLVIQAEGRARAKAWGCETFW